MSPSDYFNQIIPRINKRVEDPLYYKMTNQQTNHAIIITFNHVLIGYGFVASSIIFALFTSTLDIS